MKTKVSNAMVAHVWANYREGNELSREYNSYVEGCSMSTGGTQAEYLYSWETLIGQRCEVFGQEFYLLSDTRYSSSTGKHQSYMRGAIPHDAQITELYIKGDFGERVFASDLGTRKGRLALANRLIDQNLEQSEKALTSAGRRRAPQTRNADHGDYIAYREIAQQVKALLHSTRILPDPDPDIVREVQEWEANTKERDAQAQARREAQNIRLREERQEQFDRWLAGEVGRCDGLHIFPTSLRIKGERVETTAGANIALSEALDCFRRWKALELRKGDTVGGFAYRGELDGQVTIGCHRIAVSEIERVLKSHAA